MSGRLHSGRERVNGGDDTSPPSAVLDIQCYGKRIEQCNRLYGLYVHFFFYLQQQFVIINRVFAESRYSAWVFYKFFLRRVISSGWLDLQRGASQRLGEKENGQSGPTNRLWTTMGQSGGRKIHLNAMKIILIKILKMEFALKFRL